ncbi:hypothetical protein D6792_02780 [Candidatus Parcubacteria bacterium]|nr:MAG: hypothetical protein D6792_02780 [Candidatus Parcubacteria bacterium]
MRILRLSLRESHLIAELEEVISEEGGSDFIFVLSGYRVLPCLGGDLPYREIRVMRSSRKKRDL